MNKEKNVLFNRKEYEDLSRSADDLNRQVSTFATYGAVLLSIGAFLTLSIVAPFSWISMTAGMCVINVVFHTFFVEKHFGPKVKKWTGVYCVVFLMISMPIQWFGTGGFHGTGGLWMIFSAVYCLFSIKGVLQFNIVTAMAIENIVIMVVNYFHPEYASNLTTTQEKVIGVASIVGIAFYVEVIEILQNIEFLKDRKKLETVQEEMTAHYEESIAMNEELMATTKKLELANKTQRSFTASMNHELRSPLNGIEGCLQILKMDESLSVEARETVRNALTACKTINQTVNDLLDFAKLEEGQFEIVNKPFDIRDVLDNISIMFKPLANGKNLKFLIQIPTDTRVSLFADGVRIQQIMTNLISNGIKYTSEGSVVMTIITKRGHLIFDVKDTGQGMSKESLDTLFDPFTRFNLNENVHIQGTGLGMNIVSNMIKTMKGTISVESEVGVGTSFYVDIPIMFYDSDITYNSPRENNGLVYSKVDLSQYKVLCIDDTEINRTVFKGMLKQTGAYVVTAENGLKAIQLCEEQHFDIVFVDHMMPMMDGIETMERIRNLPGRGFEEVPFIIFTGNSAKEYLDLYKEHNADGYLLKPVMYNELIDCFNNAKHKTLVS